MGEIYLVLMFAFSTVNLAVLTVFFRKQQNNFIFYVFCATVVANFGHMLLGFSTTLEGAIIANKVNYLGAAFLPMFMFLALLKVCKLRISKFLGLFLLLLSVFVCTLSMTVGYSPVYYKTVEFLISGGVGNYVATYGWGHDVFNVMLLGYVVSDIAIIVFAALRRKSVSVKNIVALTLIEIVTISSFLVARSVENDTLVMPMVYVIDQVLLLYICSNVKWYDIFGSVVKSMENDNVSAYVSFSTRKLYLGCNDIALKYFPALVGCRVDWALANDSEMGKLFNPWVTRLEASKTVAPFDFHRGGRYYHCTVKVLPQIYRKRVYLFKIEDNTEVRLYIDSLGKNQSRLKKTIAENSNFMHVLQEQMIVGMAKMVESRDANTGGHIMRTSEVVKILADEIRKDETQKMSGTFLKAVVASAPMHDLGKIAVDDQILRKPGKFTKEEFEIMKTHAAKGAVIVENLLTSIEDPEFVRIAKNVANFHHERWDGGGYPMGLAGENIPLEARIMAVADVFDALVSRRCYKDRMDFNDAYDIIVDGMGSQFDPALEKYFVEIYDSLMKYYVSVQH